MRLIDADALIEKIENDEFDRVRNDYQAGYNDGIFHVSVVVDNFPTVNAVPVIRCRECEYNQSAEWVNCDIHPSMFGRTTDNYCSRAKRKEE